jgi:hypothetical protein
MAGALDRFEQAVASDPGFAPALAWAAVCHARRRLDGYTEDPQTTQHQAARLAEQALALAGDDPGVLANVALVLGDDGDAEISSAIAHASQVRDTRARAREPAGEDRQQSTGITGRSSVRRGDAQEASETAANFAFS